jgi:hypothetical protein
MTAKGIGNIPDNDWQTFDHDSHSFATREEVNQFLADEYGKCKRSKMYRDGKDGKPIQVGYIYHFKNNDISHLPVEKWYQQDWVEITEVGEETILV